MPPSWALLWVMMLPWATLAPPLLAGVDTVPL